MADVRILDKSRARPSELEIHALNTYKIIELNVCQDVSLPRDWPASIPAIIRDLTVALIYYSWQTSIELNVMEKFG